MAIDRALDGKGTGAWPQVAKTVGTLVATIASKNEYGLVDSSVTVPVILLVVKVRMFCEELFAGFSHRCRAVVSRFAGRCFIRLCLLGDLIGTENIEHEIEQSARLFTKVVNYGTRTESLVVAGSVEYLVVEISRVVVLEWHVTGFHQNDQLSIDAVGVPRCFRWQEPERIGLAYLAGISGLRRNDLVNNRRCTVATH